MGDMMVGAADLIERLTAEKALQEIQGKENADGATDKPE